MHIRSPRAYLFRLKHICRDSKTDPILFSTSPSHSFLALSGGKQNNTNDNTTKKTMTALQDITDAWGRWWASQRSTSLNWTETTDYGNHSELDAWHQYQVNATLLNFAYDGASPPTGSATVAYSQTYYNGTDITQSGPTFAYNTTSQQSFTWSFTESLKIGVEVSATVGLPGDSATAKLSVELGLSATQAKTVQNTQTWSVSCPILIPAHTAVTLSMVISGQSYDTTWTADVRLQGYVNVWLNDRWNGHYCYFVPISQVFTDVQANNLADLTGYTINFDGVVVRTSGSLAGSQGVSVGTTADQHPYSGPPTPSIIVKSAGVPGTAPTLHPLIFAGEK
jgi:hypothetical protein